MNNIKLSICIATLNRANFIGATLDSIICQATDEIEIVVLDGASTDNTAEVVQRYQAHFPRLRYFQQKANMGVDHDFAEAVDRASGEYCWLFSDDDLLKPGAIQTVLNAIKGRYALIIANAEVRNSELSEVYEPRKLHLNADRIYKPDERQHLLADTGDYLSFIGCVIIKSSLWRKRDKRKYFGSLFVHVGVIFQSFLAEDTLVIAEPLIAIRYGNAMWFEKYFEIWMFKWPELIWSFSGYPDDAKQKVCPREPWRKLRTLLLIRAKGGYSLNAYRKWLKPRLKFGWKRAASRTIACIPGRALNFMAIAYYTAAGREPIKELVLIDLRKSQFYFRGTGKQPSVNIPTAWHKTDPIISVPSPNLAEDRIRK